MLGQQATCIFPVLLFRQSVFLTKNLARLSRFHNEDASVGTFLAPLDIRRRHDIR